eukprot:GHVS01001475.1.p1 GENE.GHVS01001475.1~~GHVS01001475.1.p1  ORF type:complete len:855 (-),score=147.10 GHVS01001475.1:1-2565(-)
MDSHNTPNSPNDRQAYEYASQQRSLREPVPVQSFASLPPSSHVSSFACHPPTRSSLLPLTHNQHSCTVSPAQFPHNRQPNNNARLQSLTSTASEIHPPTSRIASSALSSPSSSSLSSTSSSSSPRHKRSSCFAPCSSIGRGVAVFSSELTHIKLAIIDAGNNFFGRWALIVYRHPYAVICCALLSSLIFGVGLIPGIPQWTDGAENLYSLPYSIARDHRSMHDTFFGDTAKRRNALILTDKEREGDNILKWDLLQQVKRIDGIVRGRDIDSDGRMIRIAREDNEVITTTADSNRNNLVAGGAATIIQSAGAIGSDDNTEGISTATMSPILDRNAYLTFEDICARTPWLHCSVDSVLEMGLEQWRDILGRRGEQPLIPVFGGLVVNPSTKQFYVPEYFLGGTDIHDCVLELPQAVVEQLVPAKDVLGDAARGSGYKECRVQCISRVSAFLMTFDEDDKPAFLDRNDRWEEAFISTMENNQQLGSLHISLQAFRSRDDELKASTAESNDVVFVVLTFVILISYSSALNFSCDLYRSKSYAALAGAGAAMLGLVSGMGLVSLCQVAMVPTVLICPFLVMGIGVDDMFVIINSYSLSYMVQSAEDRCVVSLRDSGLSITITTTTNLIAFAVGAFSPYMSIKNFCIYSAASLALGYLYVLTFFFAFLCLDAKREETARVCFFCLPRTTPSNSSSANSSKKGDSTGGDGDAGSHLHQISTYSLVTYKVKLSADDKISATANRKGAAAGASTSSLSAASAGPPGERKKEGSRRCVADTPSTNAGVKTAVSTSSLTSALASCDPVLARQAVFEEPRGNVGRKWRQFFLNYYGPFLMRPTVKQVRARPGSDGTVTRELLPAFL